MKKLSALIVMLCALFPLYAEAQSAVVLLQLRKQFDFVSYEPGDAMIIINKGGQEFRQFGQTRGKYGFADTLGQVIVEPKYRYVSRYVNGYAIAAGIDPDEYKFTLLDMTGREVLPREWDTLSFVYDSVTVGSRKTADELHDYSIIHLSGRIMPLKYQRCRGFFQGLACVGSGSYVKHEKVTPDNRPYTRTVFEGLYGYITTDGKLAIPCQFKEARDFSSEGLAAVAEQGKYYLKWGFIDCFGNKVTPCNYYSVGDFAGGMSVVGRVVGPNKLVYGYIDSHGKEVIPCCYDEAMPFKYENAWVGINKEDGMRYMLINKRGEQVFPYEVHELQDGGRFGQAVAALPDQEGRLRYGILDASGRVLLPFEYDEITIFSERNPLTGHFREAVMAKKNGEQFSFDIMSKHEKPLRAF